jgi:thiosulfate dehydrogenase
MVTMHGHTWTHARFEHTGSVPARSEITSKPRPGCSAGWQLLAALAEARDAKPFEPPPDTAIPAEQVRRGREFGAQIFPETGTYAPQFVGNELRCSNCHLQAGRQAEAAPMWAAYVSYPAYRSKNGRVNSFQERLQGCSVTA